EGYHPANHQEHREPGMKLESLACAITVVGLTVGSTVASGQSPLSSEYLAHLTAAKNAARFDWTGVLARNCIAPAVGPVLGNYSTDPGREAYYAAPEKVFDNLYFLGTRFHTSWALTTGAGIILIDTLYNYATIPELVNGLKAMHLDPA